MYEFDDRRRPLHVGTIAGRVSLAELHQLESDVTAILRTRASFGLIWDLRALEFPPREIVTAGMQIGKRLAMLTKDHYEDPSDPPLNYVGFVVTPRIARLVDFIHRIPVRGVNPLVFASIDEGVAAAERELSERGVSLPPRM